MFLQNSPLKILALRYKLIVFSGLVVGLGLVVALLLLSWTKIKPLEYRADSQVLIISQSRFGVDPYTAAKSAERVGENLVQVIGTNDFFQKVIGQNSSLDVTRFVKLSERAKRQLWQKTLTANVVYGTGMLNISAYHKDTEQAKAWSLAAAQALASRGWEYVGGDVIMKVVNEPIVTRFPVRPNLFLNGILGFVVGVFVSTGLILKRS